ncbi:beta-lactamase family protein [bacterium SCSIO 12741]|nr:beta-lactamase family protein [bacterium SCSIO 12741]
MMKLLPGILLLLIFNLLSGKRLIAQSWEMRFEALLDSVYQANEDALGILIHVESRDQHISWTSARGFSDSSRTSQLTSNQPVLLASNTKTYVSSATLKLVELNKFTLDQSIKGLLTDGTQSLLQEGGYSIEQITVRQLLSHTSGINDYVDKNYFELVINRPQYHWKKNEQIQRALSKGPISDPGQEFHYGDINYLLLTEIIEQQTQKPFYTAIRELLNYQQYGLNSTWFINLEEKPEHLAPMAHQYAQNFHLDSYAINPSWDLYGGGGMAATVKDAAVFYNHLFEGKMIQDEELLKEMYTYVLPAEKSKYCLGIYHFDFGYHLYYHGGWWGTDVNYCPETKTSVAVFTLVKEKQHTINPFLGKTIQGWIFDK